MVRKRVLVSKIDLQSALQTYRNGEDIYKICINCGKETKCGHHRYISIQCCDEKNKKC